MQKSYNCGFLYGSKRLCKKTVAEPKTSSNWPMSQNHNFSGTDGSQVTHPSVNSFEQYYTLESSSVTSSYPPHNSLSTTSFSPNGSPASLSEPQSYSLDQQQYPDYTCSYPFIESCILDDVDDLRNKIRELENVMLGNDYDVLDTCTTQNQFVPNNLLLQVDQWKELEEMISIGDLKGLLCACAKAVADNDMVTTEWLFSELRKLVSVSGEPIQRLGAYMLEGLVARLSCSGSSIYKALRSKEPTSAELFTYMQLFFEVVPILKFGYMSANGAIAEAVKNENVVHIIDFQILQGNQWITLIHALATRPGGPPRIRITCLDYSNAAYARGGGLEILGKRLARLAEECKVPFEFIAVDISINEVQLEDLAIQPGESIVVNFAYSLHHIPDESVSSENHRDRLVRMAKSLSPKVVTLVEAESNANTTPLFPRFVETLKFFGAMFESIDTMLPRENKDRINIEQHCMAREIVNIIACEGAERIERVEPHGKWRYRFTMAGFTPYPLSPFVNATIKSLMKDYSDKYSIQEKDGALFLGWMDKVLITSCAWI